MSISKPTIITAKNIATESKLKVSQWGVKAASASFTRESTSDLVLAAKENDMLVAEDDSDSQLDALQGETLVPNSPAPDAMVLDSQGKRVDNVDNIIDKRGHPLACVFVANLNKHKSEDELNLSIYQKFKKWGNIINVKVLKDWLERPYAFVQYEKASDASLVLSKAHGTILHGRQLRCEPAKVNRTLVIVSMGGPLVKKDLTNEISKYGPIENMEITQKSFAPFARIKFSYRDDAINAFLKLQAIAPSRFWTVEWIANFDQYVSVEKKYALKNTCVYIGNLDQTIEKSDIEKRFGVYGSIESISIIKKFDSQYKTAFGFIKFAIFKSALVAIIAEDGQVWHGLKIRVSYPNNRQRHPHHASYARGKTPPSTSQTEFCYSHPHPPGLGISAAAASAAAAYVYGTTYLNTLPPPFATPHWTPDGIAVPHMPSKLTIPTITAGQDQGQHEKQVVTKMTSATTVDHIMDASSRSAVSTPESGTQPNQQLLHPSYNFQRNDQFFHPYHANDTNYMGYGYCNPQPMTAIPLKQQNQQGYIDTYFPPPGSHFWDPSTHHSPMVPPTPPMYDASNIAYYQMYPYAGTFYFIPIPMKHVPCMGPAFTAHTNIRPPLALENTFANSNVTGTLQSFSACKE